MTDEIDPKAPAVLFGDLPPETRRWIAGLDEKDIDALAKGLDLVRTALAFGKVTKWLIVGAIGLFLGFVMLWEAVLKFLSFFRS